MALTVTMPNYRPTSFGATQGSWASSASMKSARLQGDASYPNVGYAVTPGTFGFTNTIITIVAAPGQTPWTCWYDSAAQSVRILLVGAVSATEVVSASSLATMQLEVVAVGV